MQKVLPLLAHLSQLAGSVNREAAPELHRGQKVCARSVLQEQCSNFDLKLSPGADARWRLGRQCEVELFEQEFVIGLWMSIAA